MDDTENTPPNEDTAGTTAPRMSAGRRVHEARETLGIPAAKLCADLRISTATLEALEAGEYGKLAGAPYVRATLVSLARALRLDARELLDAFAEETGSRQATSAPVSPYKDDSGTHARAHKQIFILLLAVLLFVLLLIMGKVNTSAPAPEPAAPPATGTDTLLNIAPVPEPDSLSVDSAATTLADTAAAIVPPEEETTHATRVRVLALGDSVWLRVLPAGERERSAILLRNQPREFSNRDAITFITRRGGMVRVFLGDSSVVPDKKRFKVDGVQVTY
jgi:cytoskeletal protein RodZ